MPLQPLLTLDEAARQLGVPKGSLKSAAERHGLLVRMGRAVRIDPNTIEELFEKCRENPKVPASIGERTSRSGSFVTPDAQTYQPALATAAMLKRH